MPEVIYLVVGSNDVDDYELHTKKYRRWAMNPFHYERCMNRDLREWYMDLREHMVEIVELITEAYLGVPIFYLNILPRPWWGSHSRTLASYIDHFMNTKFDGIVR